MNYYQKRKEQLRQEAIEWQADLENGEVSWLELAFGNDYFYSEGKKYGLLKEFKENDIC